MNWIYPLFISREILVSAVWTGLNEDVVVDSEVYTDLDPVVAPMWIARLVLNDQVPSLLIKSLCSFLDLCRSSDSTEQLLGKNYTVLQSPGKSIQFLPTTKVFCQFQFFLQIVRNMNGLSELWLKREQVMECCPLKDCLLVVKRLKLVAQFLKICWWIFLTFCFRMLKEI